MHSHLLFGVFCIYETLSTLKVRDQRRESKAFSEWGAKIQGDARLAAHSSLPPTLPAFSVQFHSLLILNLQSPGLHIKNVFVCVFLGAFLMDTFRSAGCLTGERPMFKYQLGTSLEGV